MKNIITLLGGASLTVLSTPVIFAGETAQATARGLLHTADAFNALGERVELKGLTLKDKGLFSVKTAKDNLSLSREERAAERAAIRERKAREASAYREARIGQLRMAQEARRRLEELKDQVSAGIVPDLAMLRQDLGFGPA